MTAPTDLSHDDPVRQNTPESQRRGQGSQGHAAIPGEGSRTDRRRGPIQGQAATEVEAGSEAGTEAGTGTTLATPSEPPQSTVRPRGLPRTWVAALISFVGIVGMRLVYGSLTHGNLAQGLIGAVLLVVAVVILGTPLAYAYHIRREVRTRS